jgi:3-oxoacyl-[acyl-carrier-protein] synthase II
MQFDPIVITGIGPVSAIGCGKENFWLSLIQGRSGIGKIRRFDATNFLCNIAAEVEEESLQELLPGIAARRKYSRSVKLAIAAANLAILDAKLENAYERDKIGVFAGTSVANLPETFLGRDLWLKENKVRPDSSFQVFNHSAACMISSLFDLRGPTITVTTGCNSGMDALGHAKYAIQMGTADAMLVVGTDCEVFPEIMSALDASGSLSKSLQETPRPFDANRDGVVLAEGAAAILLERESAAIKRGADIYARLSGYASCAAGRNRTYSPSPELDDQPAASAIRKAIAEAGWKLNEIDLIHANGSGSIAYDKLEVLAFRKIWSDNLPSIRIHSIKSMIGLPGGAASALQIVAACLSVRRGKIPPTVYHENCDPELAPLRVVRETESFQPGKILVHSIGLGGFYYSAAAISAVDQTKN